MMSAIYRLSPLVLLAFLPRMATSQLYNFQNPGDAERFMHYILMEFGLTPNDIFIRPSEDVSNAKAVVEEGKRYIYYNADWLTNLSQVSGEEADWINMGILTHELGHHMKFHPVTFEDSSIELELEADWWSGFALRRLGARLEQAMSAVETTAPNFQAGHHPPRKLRRQAVQSGFRGEPFDAQMALAGEVQDTISAEDQADATGTVTFEGQTYRTRRFGELIWMTENLNYDIGWGNWCFKDNRPDCDASGRMYQWRAAKIACRLLGEGWRLPTADEVRQMVKPFGRLNNEYSFTVAQSAKRLYQQLLSGGESGFNASLPGWSKAPSSSELFNKSLGNEVHYWTSTMGEYGQVFNLGLFTKRGGYADLSKSPRQFGFHCRCVFGAEKAERMENKTDDYGLPPEEEPEEELNAKTEEVPSQEFLGDGLLIGGEKYVHRSSMGPFTKHDYMVPDPKYQKRPIPIVDSTTALYFEGEYYPVKRYGKLTWMTKNLNYEVEGSWCYDLDPENCRIYGRLYPWDAARRACKALGDGWRLPTMQEWEELEKHVVGSSDNTEIESRIYEELIIGGVSGFNAQLGGEWNSPYLFRDLGGKGHYWSATLWSDNGEDQAPVFFSLYDKEGEVSYKIFQNTEESPTSIVGISCRCVKD